MAKDKPQRQPGDGEVSVTRDKDTRLIVLHADTSDGREHMILSEFQARRILAGLSVILDLSLSKAAQKEIEL